MSDRQSSANNNPKRNTIQDAEFEEVSDFPEPRQWTPSASTASPNATFTDYVFGLVKRRSFLTWWMWIALVTGNTMVFAFISDITGVVFEFKVSSDALLTTGNIGTGALWSLIIALILCWKWRAQLRREKASERQ